MISPGTDTITVGERRQLTASAHTSSGAVIPESEFSWFSRDATIAVVSGTGLVTAVQPGEVTIGATTGSVAGTAQVVVVERR